MTIRVLVADDHGVLRAGLRALITAQPDMSVVADAASATDAWEAVQAHQPDVAVLDLGLSGMRTDELIGRISSETDCRVLVLTMHAQPEYQQSSLAAGALGFLVKSAADVDLIAAIRSVHGGASVIDAGLDSRGRDQAGHGVPLSQREREVLSLLAAGFSYEETARRLSVTPKTIETYRTRIGRKLGIQNRAGLIAYALRMGLLAVPT